MPIELVFNPVDKVRMSDMSRSERKESSFYAQNLTQRYGTGPSAVTALDNVSLSVPQGEWTTVMGASGSGKTTLLHVLAGLKVPTSGEVWLGDREITRLGESARAKLRRTEIGVVFQEFNLVPVLNVRDNLLLPLRLAHRKVDRRHFDEVVETLGLGGRLRHLPHELSGGQRQRVAIGRAVLARPAVMFADEPTGSLDSETGTEVLRLFRRLVDEMGQTLMLITHDERAASFGDNLVRMKDGRIVS